MVLALQITNTFGKRGSKRIFMTKNCDCVHNFVLFYFQWLPLAIVWTRGTFPAGSSGPTVDSPSYMMMIQFFRWRKIKMFLIVLHSAEIKCTCYTLLKIHVGILVSFFVCMEINLIREIEVNSNVANGL